MGWVVNSTPRPLYLGKGSRCPLYRRLVEPQGQSGRVRKISPSTGIRSPDRPARSESLYRQRYPRPPQRNYNLNNMNGRYPEVQVRGMALFDFGVCVCVFWCTNNSLFRLLYAGTCGLGSHGTNSKHKQQETYFISSVNVRQTFVFSSVYIA